MAINSVIGKLNKEAIAKAVTKSDGMAGKAGGASFSNVMQQVESGAEFANMVGIGGNTNINPTGQMMSLNGENVSYMPTEQTTSISPPEASGKVVDMLGEVNKGQMQMDSLVNHVLYGGKKFSNQELLVVQAHVFHFAQMTELTVKVAEQSISSVKSVLNTQVQ
ncbi:MAG: hypothetical protein HN337_08485 [Deltaproteobacteria bacterium]|jgi:hypothetical protein|nr:hypothetical protein [Deltaproteobacteria bacterium]